MARLCERTGNFCIVILANFGQNVIRFWGALFFIWGHQLATFGHQSAMLGEHLSKKVSWGIQK